ncbi:hypothetical protein [Pseudoduganella lutea]|uniref:Uncharacterized protein n=1 Tax=Pseudoduganella lutea TaxID=321985 RepID=A0A4P6L783_9BURK|nr:hypothetical protein [Pseudoduganella lutea]QBE66828.1 hypothetical protein EWM63_30860 [Pseudoduganella lutea]
MNINHLSLSWSTSRGRETYGYNICRLDDRNTGRRFRCMGGGYDMIGTVFGMWLEETYQDRLQALRGTEGTFYGLRFLNDGKASLDGGTGINSMTTIAEAIGLEVEREYAKKGRNRGNTLGWYVTEKEGA